MIDPERGPSDDEPRIRGQEERMTRRDWRRRLAELTGLIEQRDEAELEPELAEAEAEAEMAGPWRVEQAANGWEVRAEGEEGPPLAMASRRDLAQMIAAVLPGMGRLPLFMLEDAPEGQPLAVMAHTDTEVALVRLRFDRLDRALHLLDMLRRSPFDLARVLAAAPASAVDRALVLAAGFLAAAVEGPGESLDAASPAAKSAPVLDSLRLLEEPTADHEAELASPWRLGRVPSESGRPEPEWTVVPAGRERREWVVRAWSYPTAALITALLPGFGREPFYSLGPRRAREGFPLLAEGEPAGAVRVHVDGLAEALHALEALRRSPESLARLFAACGGAGLERALRLSVAMRLGPGSEG